MKSTHDVKPRPEAGCRLCRRVRWMVAGACVAALAGTLAWQVGAQARDGTAGGAAGASATTDRTPATSAATFVVVRPAAAASVATPERAETVPAGTFLLVPEPAGPPNFHAHGEISDDRYLPLRTVPLRTGKRAELYRPLLLVTQAADADEVRLTGQLPPGLLLGGDGNLRGVPTLAGLFQFQLEVIDRVSKQTLARQGYAVRILAPARAVAVTPAPEPVAKPSLKTLTESDSAAYTDVNKAVPATYLLTSIAPWVPTEEAARPGSDAASAVVPTPSDADPASDAPVTAVEAARLPTIDQLRAMLAPLVDIEYPTRALFAQALQTSRCGYYREHLLALAKGRAVDTACPPAAASAAASASGSRSPGDPMSLAQFYQELLPPRIEQDVIDAALKLHPIADSQPLVLTGDGCGCHVPKKDDNVYGMFPYWLATKESQPVDFSLFSHIGYMGAVLQDDGKLAMPAGSTDDAAGFARVAAQHETSVDLVVYRRDWSTLLRLSASELDKRAFTAAQEAVQETELRFDDATARWLQPLLVPGWRAEGRVYAGLTIFFDDTSVEPAQRAAFKRFYKVFAEELVHAMQRHGHSYHLNFVVPDAELGDEDGAYGFAQLADYMELAQREPGEDHPDALTKLRYKGNTDILVFYLVTLGAPTSESRLDLRTRIDHTPALDDHRRVAFLQGIVPMVFGARMPGVQQIPAGRATAINNDLAYMRWSYGGVGFWPAPMLLRGQADPLHDLLVNSYKSSDTLVSSVCEVACPRRLLLRLLFQTTLLIDLAALVAYAWSCRLRRAGGRRLLMLVWLAGLATLVAGGIVFTCDPLLDTLRAGNWPFVAVLALVVLWGGYKTFRPRMDPP